jgi:hypothetical protein
MGLHKRTPMCIYIFGTFWGQLIGNSKTYTRINPLPLLKRQSIHELIGRPASRLASRPPGTRYQVITWTGTWYLVPGTDTRYQRWSMFACICFNWCAPIQARCAVSSSEQHLYQFSHQADTIPRPSPHLCAGRAGHVNCIRCAEDSLCPHVLLQLGPWLLRWWTPWEDLVNTLALLENLSDRVRTPNRSSSKENTPNTQNTSN